MSSASSAVTYTSVYTDSEPGRVFWGADEEISDGGPEHPPSPDYVSGPEHPPSPVYLPYVPEPEYPEYLAPSNDEAPTEDQPLPNDASLVALSPGYVSDSDSEKDPEEDSEEEHADYPTDEGDGDDEPFDDDDDDDDTDDEDKEPTEDEEDEEHLAPADPSAVPVVDHVPSAGDIEAFETDESAPTPRSPQTRVLFSLTRLRRARKTVRLEPPMSASMEARIAEYAAAPIPPTSPVYDPAPLGHRATMILMRNDIPEEDMTHQRRFILTAPPPGCDVAESSAAAIARPPKDQYDFIDIVKVGHGLIHSPGHDARTIARAADRARDVRYVRALQAFENRMMTSIEEVNLRVSYQAHVHRQESEDFYTQLLDARTDRRDIRLKIDVVRE
ncbi:hypothetical protein Tco_1574652, partial [Tanacetum coccineum]